MSKTHKEEFAAELAERIATRLREGGLRLGCYDSAGNFSWWAKHTPEDIAAWLIDGWSVDKGRPSSCDHPLYEGPDMVRFKIRTPARELNDAEKAAAQAVTDRYRWVHGHDQSSPPPESVTFVELLRQQVWWDHGTKLADLTPGERLRAMKALESVATKLHRASAFRFAGCPDEGLVEQFLDEDPAEWLKTEPLVQKLAELIKADGKRPCLFRWGGPVDHVDEDQVEDTCSMAGDYRHQCNRKHDHRKPHRCMLCRAEQSRTPLDTPPSADTKLSDLLDQGIWWVTKKGEQIKLVDMEPSHRANSLAYLKRNADRLVSQAYGGYMADAPDFVQSAFERADSWATLSETPLVKNLALLVAQDAAVKALFPPPSPSTGKTVNEETVARFMNLGATERMGLNDNREGESR